jgi:hypothetical protein
LNKNMAISMISLFGCSVVYSLLICLCWPRLINDLWACSPIILPVKFYFRLFVSR